VVEVASDDEVGDVIEATHAAFEKLGERTNIWYGFQEEGQFRDRVNVILAEHDVAYVVEGREVLPRSAEAMWGGVVEPTRSLLGGDGRLVKSEQAFQKALRELKPGDDPADAITDAATALQETLDALGCRGNTIGKKLDDARKKGLLGPHDSTLAASVEGMGDWVSADRSERGDAHGVKDVTVDDAWLTVHVTGALILRLSKRL
jgi:hypothetical protein